MSDLLKRIGTFRVERNLIYEKPEEVLNALKDVLVVKIDYDFPTNNLVYVGYSKYFDITNEEFAPPNYNIEMNSITNEIKWHRKTEYSDNDVKVMLEEIKNEIRKNKADHEDI